MKLSMQVICSLFCMYMGLFLASDRAVSALFLKNTSSYDADVEWAVIGAGPAGIVTVGMLCDLGVKPSSILWLDPLFNAGRIGEYYTNVPGNTKTKMYVEFLKACHIFQEVQSPAIENLYALDPESYEKLGVIAQPLQDITAFLRTKVKSVEGLMDSLYFDNGVWVLGSQGNKFTSKHVVLATGSHPKTLDYQIKDIIPLDYALDEHVLHTMVKPVDSIAVVGSAHSAILILKYLTATSVKKIVSLYTRPLVYAVDMGGWMLNNTHGLKGIAAQWAREVLEGNPPANLIRCLNTPENRALHLPTCNKIIYAIGYEKNDIPHTQSSNEVNELAFDPDTGVIGPRIFGIGIAFPGAYIDPSGNREQLIGLNSFMKYAQKVMPSWVNGEFDQRAYVEHVRALMRFEDLFIIHLL